MPLDAASRNYNQNAEDSRCGARKQAAVPAAAAGAAPLPLLWLRADRQSLGPHATGGGAASPLPPPVLRCRLAHPLASPGCRWPTRPRPCRRSKIKAAVLQSARLDMRTSFAAGFVEGDRLVLFPVDEVGAGRCCCEWARPLASGWHGAHARATGAGRTARARARARAIWSLPARSALPPLRRVLRRSAGAAAAPLAGPPGQGEGGGGRGRAQEEGRRGGRGRGGGGEAAGADAADGAGAAAHCLRVAGAEASSRRSASV